MELPYVRVWILLKFCGLIALIIILPKFLFEKKIISSYSEKNEKFLLGISNLLANGEQFKGLKQLRLGFVSIKRHENDAYIKSIRGLVEHEFPIKKVFLYNATPGKQIAVQKGKAVIDSIPIVPFLDFTLLDIKKELHDIDVLLVDMPFLGVRCDPAVSILTEILTVGSVHHKQVIVLDRPNPLGGIIEGPGIIPLRCGVTLGELSYYINSGLARKTSLLVVPMVGWNRTMSHGMFMAADLNKKKCYGFGLNVLFGGMHPLDIGANTVDAYTILALPKSASLSDWELNYLQQLYLDFGLNFKIYEYYQNYKKEEFKGLRLHEIRDPSLFSSFNSFLTIAKFFLNRKQVTISFLQGFDMLAGSSDVKNYLQGVISFEKLKQVTEKSMNIYFEKIKPYFLYSSHPKIYQVCLFNGSHD